MNIIVKPFCDIRSKEIVESIAKKDEETKDIQL